MPADTLRIGLIGAGANTRQRHIPGLRAIPGVEIVAVCNRRRSSAEAVAKEFGIARIHEHWQEVVDAKDIDAVVIGTWPYLHCPITLAALERGKHVLTEARMAMNAAESHRMLEASRRHPKIVTQIVPSPFGLKGHDVFKEIIENGYLGRLRELHVYGLTPALADAVTPLGWRQDIALSGCNMLTLGIIHETVSRWVAPVVRVMAQVHAFFPERIDPASGVRRAVGTPDSVQVLTVHADGARGVYQFSGVVRYGAKTGVCLYGDAGALWYGMDDDLLFGAKTPPKDARCGWEEIPIPENRARRWRVEEEFVEAIRTGKPIEMTPFEAGVQYMEFTEAVARSAQSGEAVDLPMIEL